MIYAEFTRAYANFLTGHSRNLHMSGVLFRKYYRDLSQLIYRSNICTTTAPSRTSTGISMRKYASRTESGKGLNEKECR